MQKATGITTLFLDVGGVLLSDGWDRHARRRAAEAFKLEWDDLEERHHLTSATYEEGRLTLAEYLSLTVFYEARPFSLEQFRDFMFAQSTPHPEMLELVARLRVRHGLKIVVVSNEARELNAYRILKFELDALVDCFVSSCFVHVRKPDAAIYRLALDVAQAPIEQVLYIENTPLFVKIAADLGIRGILHTDYGSTCAQLAALGLQD